MVILFSVSSPKAGKELDGFFLVIEKLFDGLFCIQQSPPREPRPFIPIICGHMKLRLCQGTGTSIRTVITGMRKTLIHTKWIVLVTPWEKISPIAKKSLGHYTWRGIFRRLSLEECVTFQDVYPIFTVSKTLELKSYSTCFFPGKVM